MKMMKSLLLVSAAGLVAVSGAQAADLPKKAKAVEYVKACSLYGAGFYYVAGTDICMKIGNYVRWQITANPGSSIGNGPMSGTGGRSTRTDSMDFGQRARAIATFDTRQQTAYGTLRTYILMGFTSDSTAAPGATIYATRAFMQIAGFTFGRASSFFDFASTAAVAYNAGPMHSSDTGDGGQLVAAYTAQLGSGWSANISAEQTRRLGTVDLSTNATATTLAYSLVTLTNPAGSNLNGLGVANVGQFDIVGSLRLDQAWGSAQVGMAAHDVSASYNSGSEQGGVAGAGHHPGNKWGTAYMAGLRLNAPMIGAGDYFQGQLNYSQGATGYLTQAMRANAVNKWSGQTVGYGFFEDAVYSNTGAGSTGNSIELTTGFSVFASYEHFWTPALRTSAYGTYIQLTHNAAATNAICTSQNFTGSAFQGGTGCSADWSMWGVGSRTQWNITKDLYVGLDVLYQKLNSGTSASGFINTPASGAKPAGVAGQQYTVADQSAVMATWRIHRDIVP